LADSRDLPEEGRHPFAPKKTVSDGEAGIRPQFSPRADYAAARLGTFTPVWIEANFKM
jgi:hypothetical protein